MIQKGTYAELLSSSRSLIDLIRNISQQQSDKQSEYDQESVAFSRLSSKLDPEVEADGKLTSAPENIETKQEGMVKWNVFVSYLRAGIGVIPGLLLILVIFTVHQAISILSTWWLAKWSDDEGHRHSVFGNCTNTVDQQTNSIRSLDETQWNEHRNQRFYTYCCKPINLVKSN